MIWSTRLPRTVEATVRLDRRVGLRHHLPLFEKSEDVKIVGFRHFRFAARPHAAGGTQTGDSIEITARKVPPSNRARAEAADQRRRVVTAVMPETPKLYYRIGGSSRSRGAGICLRYWESNFKPGQEEPRRQPCRPQDLELVQRRKTLLYGERLTLEGAKKRLLAESRKTGQLDLDSARFLRRGAQADRSPRRTTLLSDALKRRRLSGHCTPATSR
jgi:hypothetical protein